MLRGEPTLEAALPRTLYIFSCIAVLFFMDDSHFEHEAVRELRLNRPPVNALSPDLLQDVTGGNTDYKAILVYDVRQGDFMTAIPLIPAAQYGQRRQVLQIRRT